MFIPPKPLRGSQREQDELRKHHSNTSLSLLDIVSEPGRPIESRSHAAKAYDLTLSSPPAQLFHGVQVPQDHQAILAGGQEPSKLVAQRHGPDLELRADGKLRPWRSPYGRRRSSRTLRPGQQQGMKCLRSLSRALKHLPTEDFSVKFMGKRMQTAQVKPHKQYLAWTWAPTALRQRRTVRSSLPLAT